MMRNKLIMLHACWVLTGLMICGRTLLWAMEELSPPKPDIRAGLVIELEADQ